MILVRTGPQVSDYLEVEVHDDLSARVHVFDFARDRFAHSHSEAQNGAIAFSHAARAGRPYRLNSFTFILRPDSGDLT